MYVDSNVIIDSFNNTIADSYKYVMPFNIDNQYQQNWFKPAIYAQIYFDRIFAAAGYSYTWDGLADANFDKLLIPYNGDQNVVDWTGCIKWWQRIQEPKLLQAQILEVSQEFSYR
jgi:hypothetical protein